MRRVYHYEGAIAEQLDRFRIYLRDKGYTSDTIRQHSNYVGIFLKWIEEEGEQIEEVDYQRLSPFIFHLKSLYSLGQTRRIVLAVRHYYDSLDVGHNPASGIVIRGQRHGMVNNIVDYKILEQVYLGYDTLDDRDKRNKVLLGLMIYQAVTVGGLKRLEPQHIDLSAAKITLPGYGNVQRRILSLDAKQLLSLQEYLLVVRPRMLAAVGKSKAGRKPNTISPVIYERLFFSRGGSDNLKPSIYHLFRALKKVYPSVTSATVIRSTVIAEWLKAKDVRMVQYLAGHRWVSSTERYDVHRIEELREELKKYHPMG